MCSELVRAAQRMAALNLAGGTSGNVSARIFGEKHILITPSSIPYIDLKPEDIVIMDLEGNLHSDNHPPSMEHIIHLQVYRAREDAGAIYHTHSVYASALACLGLPLPALFEEIAASVGEPVAVAAFAPSGTDELANNICRALGKQAAVLMASHGALCVGHTLEKGLHVAEIIERAAKSYLQDLGQKTPHELSEK